MARARARRHAGVMAEEPDFVGDPAQIVRLGRVMSVDLGAATCVVAMGDPDGEDGEVETGALPWLTRAGETIVWAPPSEGEQVLVLAPGGDIAQAVAIPGVYSTAFPAPGNGARQFIRFEDGAEIGYDPESGEADVTLPGGGVLRIVGDVTIDGDVAVTGRITASEDVEAAGVSLTGHTHSGVQAGGSDTGPPS
jgi:phage baseplate assembly protein V